MEDNTDSSPNDHPGAIWLSLGLVEMSEPEEGASQEATATGFLQGDTSSSDDSRPYGWTKGTDRSAGVSDPSKYHTKRRTNPPSWGKGGGSVWPKLPSPALHLGAIQVRVRYISTKSDVMQAPSSTVGSESDFSTEFSGPEYGTSQKWPLPPPCPSLLTWRDSTVA